MTHPLKFGTYCAICLFTLLVGSITADETDKVPPKHDVNQAFDGLAERVQPRQAWDAETPEEHEAWRKKMQATMVDLLGEMPEKVPLEVRWTEKKEFDKFTRHKVYVRTTADYWSPVYYFVPKNITGKRPAIVCLHGHSGIEPYIAMDGSSRTYAVYMAEHGYITAAIVVRGWNETRGRQDWYVKSPPRSCHQVTMNSLLLGMTPQGLRCWDAMRVIDFLETQEEVDADKIGVGGLSGGGTLSMYLPILEPRVKLAMIAGAFSEYRLSIYGVNHCVCNCLPGVMREGDMADVVALFAPRPVLLINGTGDEIFPIEGARRGFAKLKEVYGVLGIEDHVDADFFEGGHAWANNKTLDFLEKHFGE